MRDTVIATLIGYIAITGMLIIGSLTAHHLYKVDNDSHEKSIKQNMNCEKNFISVPDPEGFSVLKDKKSNQDTLFNSIPGSLLWTSSEE